MQALATGSDRDRLQMAQPSALRLRRLDVVVQARTLATESARVPLGMAESSGLVVR
jgi:hypothetical protein